MIFHFNFRGLNDFKEDVLYRNVEPALSFQLELNRDEFISRVDAV